MSVRRTCMLYALCALFTLAPTTRAVIDDAIEVIKFAEIIGEEVLNSWDLIDSQPLRLSGEGDLTIGIVKKREKEVLDKLAQISRSIEKLELAMQKNKAITMLQAKNVGREARLTRGLDEMVNLLSQVASADRNFREFIQYQQQSEREKFAQWCVSEHPGALPYLLEKIHSLIVSLQKDQGLLQLVLEYLQKHTDICSMQLSKHQLIIDVYNTISLTQIRGYAMMQFSWMLLSIYGKGNFKQEASQSRRKYEMRSAETAKAVRAALAIASRDLYRCDPPHHKEGETFAQVTRLLQGYIENVVDMNPDGSCPLVWDPAEIGPQKCPGYKQAVQYRCYDDRYCPTQSACKGRIFNCQSIDETISVCPATRGSNRRYDWIQYNNERTQGHFGSCMRDSTKVENWYRYIGIVHCDYCMCLCEDNVDEAERFFSLSEVVADAYKNKVVTGLKLVKHGRVFHLQIAEGMLGKRGAISGENWVPVQKFDPLDPGMRDGVDYHTLTYEKRAIDLDDLDSPTGSVLTGVRFRMLGSHLHFEIRSTPFNFTTGRLSPGKSEWISNINTEGVPEKSRMRLELIKPDIPTRSLTYLPIDSAHNQYLEFTHSDFEADVAQRTVPFVDIQPVTNPKGGMLLSGAGIIHRGAEGNGGFISVKLITYNFSRHVHAFTDERYKEKNIN